MNIQKIFAVPVSASVARYRINNYFSQAGYQPVTTEGRILTFKRGSRLGSWFPRNPSHLLSVAEVEILDKGNNTDIKAEFDVKVTFKDESHFTDDFWNNEVKEFETALYKDQYSPLKEKKLTRKAILANFKSLGPALAYILIWGILAIILTVIMINIPGTDTLDPFLVAFGIMVIAAVATFYLVRFWKRRRQAR